MDLDHWCQHLTHAGSRYGDTPEPDEYCDEVAAPGSDYCPKHHRVERENS